MNNYVYDAERLKRIDRFRHDVIHGSALGRHVGNASDEVEFLMKTALFFMGMVNLKYGLKMNPLYMQQSMAEQGA